MRYNPLVEEYFFDAQHAGEIEADLSLTMGRTELGEYFILYVCYERRVVNQASFKAYGNPFLLAGLEWICRQLEGRELASLSVGDAQQMIKDFEIPKSYYSTALQLEKGYNKIIQLLREKIE